jgi:hypothetical protein
MRNVVMLCVVSSSLILCMFGTRTCYLMILNGIPTGVCSYCYE